MSYIEYVTGDYEGQDPLVDLARANGFTMQDLEENRRGRISDKQMGMLFSRALEPVKYPGMALLGWLTCCFIVKTLIPGFVLLIISILGAKGIGVMFGAVTLICLGALLIAMLKSSRYLVLLVQDLANGKSAFLDGRVSLSNEDTRGLGMDHFHGQSRRHYAYVIQNEHFTVDEAAANALPTGGRFRLYHTPKSKLMLSIEPARASGT
ncbi:MAG: hypothetical protein HY820_13575 [Acidobacteria bacterium]|nr:hypothetical protein [Acidobacteriota bacterium]